MGEAATTGSARAVAAAIVHDVVHHGRSLDATVDDALAQLNAVQRSDAAFIQEMAYGCVRWTVQLQWLAHALLARPLKHKDLDIEALLLVGLYQVVHLRTAQHAAVAETVEACTDLHKPWAKGLVNAILRAFLRSQDAMRARIEADPALELSHPALLLQRFRQAWPDRWREICQANNERPPMVLRVNSRRTSRAYYLDELARHQIPAHPLAQVECAIMLEGSTPVSMLPGFQHGDVSVQDSAAQLAAFLLDAQAGERVLDACAAPGGKTAHILERTPEVDLTAVDIDPRRLDFVRSNLERLGLNARILTADATDPAHWWDGRHFDRILVDAPCSATGVIRRHPDIKLRRSSRDIERLCALQSRLLDALWPLLRSGGKLLYATCSVLPEENDYQIHSFMAREKSACVIPLVVPCSQKGNGGYQILPGDCGMDGFYYACLQKN